MQNDDRRENSILPMPSSMTRGTGQTDLAQKQQSSNEEKLVSMSLVDESGNILLGMMRGLDGTDGSNVMTACEVAKQITQLGRLKLDVFKAIKGLK